MVAIETRAADVQAAILCACKGPKEGQLRSTAVLTRRINVHMLATSSSHGSEWAKQWHLKTGDGYLATFPLLSI